MINTQDSLLCFQSIIHLWVSKGPLTRCNCRLLLVFSPLGQILMQHSSTISSYLFSFISQDNSPSSVCVGTSGPIFGAQNTDKKGIQVCNSMGVNHYKIWMVWANMVILEKRQQVVCRQFQQQISPFCISQEIERRSKPGPSGPSHDLDIESWALQALLTNQPSSPVLLFS